MNISRTELTIRNLMSFVFIVILTIKSCIRWIWFVTNYQSICDCQNYKNRRDFIRQHYFDLIFKHKHKVTRFESRKKSHKNWIFRCSRRNAYQLTCAQVNRWFLTESPMNGIPILPKYTIINLSTRWVLSERK